MGLSSKNVSGDHVELNWTQNMLPSNTIQSSSNPRMKRPLQSDPLKCPRCDSTNTKFCYYNNYNKTQPRHFCKACKRHWTKGGTLRNVPIGGGRKNKRVKRHNMTAATTGDHNLGSNNDQKYMFPDDKGLFFKPIGNEFDQVAWDSNGGFTGSTTIMQPQLPHQNLGFSILSNMMTSIDANPIPISPTSFSPLLNGFKDDSTTTTTRVIIPNASMVSQTWMQVPTTSNFLESNYWNWNDIDSIVHQADVNKPFEDPQMKLP